MTIIGCHGCHMCISISIMPGGNPLAKANPDKFTIKYGRCGRCGRTYCDKCIMSKHNKCPGCGRSIEIVGPSE